MVLYYYFTYHQFYTFFMCVVSVCGKGKFSDTIARTQQAIAIALGLQTCHSFIANQKPYILSVHSHSQNHF